MPRSTLNWMFVAMCLYLAGCSGGMTEKDLQSAQSAAEKAIELEKSGSYAEAFPLVDGAITKGGLNPDQLAEAYLLRARCLCAAGKLEEAERDLGFAEQGSPNPASWHFSRAILLAKQNKAGESKAEFAKAVRIDPKLKMPQ
ncbi:MAG: tetratricopeptide repeat protein [Pirellulaceae bacterium]|nr:tetratricopeptide repeat protein [Pirellulaceae bacterium]